MRAFIFRRAGVDRPRHRRCRADRLGAFARHAAGGEFLTRNGHPSPTSIWTATRTSRRCSIVSRIASEVPVLICRGDVVLRNPTNIRSPVPRASTKRSTEKVRDLVVVGAGPSDWQRPCTARPKGWTSRPRVECARGPGRVELENRKLPRLPDRDIGQELAARAHTQAQKFGAELVIANARDAADVQSEAVRDPDRGWPTGAGADGHHRNRRRVPALQPRKPVQVRRRRRLLRRLGDGGAVVPGGGGDCSRRRQFRRTGRSVSRRHRQPRSRTRQVERPWRAACRAI